MRPRLCGCARGCARRHAHHTRTCAALRLSPQIKDASGTVRCFDMGTSFRQLVRATSEHHADAALTWGTQLTLTLALTLTLTLTP